MKKIYMTFLLLMIAIVSFAEDEVVKNGIRYNLLGKEVYATLVNKELTDIVVEPEVSIEGQVYPVTYVSENSYSDVFPNAKTISVPSKCSLGFSTSAEYFPVLEEWKISGTMVENGMFVLDKCLYFLNREGEWSISVPNQFKGKLNISDKLTDLDLGSEQYSGVTSLHLGKSLSNIDFWNLPSQLPSLQSISVDAENTSFSTDPEGMMLIQNSEVQFCCAGASSINVPEGVTSCTLYYGSNPNLKQITLPSTVTNFYVQDAPNLEKFVMPEANSNYKVVDGVLFDLNNNNFILPKKAKVLDLAAAGCQMTDINLTDYPYLQKLVTNDYVESISLTNLPGLQTLVMGKNVNSFGFRDTYNIADFEINSENETFVKDANGVVMERDNSWGTERLILCYIPATVSNYCIPKDEDIREVTYARWSNLKTLTMEERDQTDSYERYFVKNNVLYKSYYGNGAIAIDAPGGITDLTFCKEMDQVYDVYGESWLNLLSKVQNISVEEGNTTFSMVGDYLCQKVYMPGYTGENEDPYQLKLVMAKPFTGTTLSLFTTLPEGFSTDSPFMGFAIGSYLYDKNAHIKELIIGENVIESDQCCFNECKNLEKVTFLGYQFTLGHMSFYGCSKLSDITFPEQLIMPNASAFYNTAWWRTQEGDMRYAGNTLYYVSNQVTDIDIPQGTYCVSQNALSNASEAKSITIPASVAYWYDESSMQKVEQLTINADYFDNLVNQAFVNYSGLKRVISSRPFPMYFEEEKINKIFPYDLSQVELIVPDDHYEIDEKTGEKYWVTPKDSYSKANEWSRFGKIVDNTTSGVGSVTADKPSFAETRFAVRGNEVDVLTKGAWSIFSMAGQLVKSGCGNGSAVLPSGMYVIKGAGKAAKFIVK